MDNNNKKKYLALIFGLILIAAIILWQNRREDKPSSSFTKNGQDTSQTRNPASKKVSTAHSSSTAKGSKQIKIKGQDQDIVYAPRTTALPLNKVDPHWQEKLIKRLKHNAEEDYKIELLDIRPHIYQKHKLTLHTHKVKIKMTAKDGLSSSYMALVNSTTGSILQTWNRTHYENKKVVSAKFEGTRLISSED